MKCRVQILLLLAVALLSGAQAQTTTFTYQGHLTDSGNPANGLYDSSFQLFDDVSAGSQVFPLVPGTKLDRMGVTVAGGLFTVPLDMGNVPFSGGRRWLQISARASGNGGFAVLVPRQEITATPFAITAGDATSPNLARLTVPDTSVQATGHPLITSGFITSALVDNAGAGYGTPPIVTVIANGPGSGAQITATVSGGIVTALNVNNPGNGYTATPTLTIAPPPPNSSQTFSSSNYFSGPNNFVGPIGVGDNIRLTGPVPASSAPYSRTVTPKNLVVAWGLVSVSTSGQATLINGFNIAAVVPQGSFLGVGFAAPLGTSDYAVIVQDGRSRSGGFAAPFTYQPDFYTGDGSQNAGGFFIRSPSIGNWGAPSRDITFSFMILGD